MNDADGYNRTLDLLMHFPDPVSVSVAHSPDPVSVIVAHSPDSVLVSAAHSPDSVPASVAHLPVPGMSHLTPTEDVDENTAICSQPHSLHACPGGAVTTRYGRHVRPPKKLIHEMSTQRVEHTVPFLVQVLCMNSFTDCLRSK